MATALQYSDCTDRHPNHARRAYTAGYNTEGLIRFNAEFAFGLTSHPGAVRRHALRRETSLVFQRQRWYVLGAEAEQLEGRRDEGAFL